MDWTYSEWEHDPPDRVARAPHVILYLDFDGTLASIVEEPALAGLSPHMDRVVRALAEPLVEPL